MLDWLEMEIGGLDRIGVVNVQNALLLYDFIDDAALSTSLVQKNSRSLINGVFDIEPEIGQTVF